VSWGTRVCGAVARGLSGRSGLGGIEVRLNEEFLQKRIVKNQGKKIAELSVIRQVGLNI